MWRPRSPSLGLEVEDELRDLPPVPVLFLFFALATAARAHDVSLGDGRLVVVDGGAVGYLLVAVPGAAGVHLEPPPNGPSATGATLEVRARDQVGNAATFALPAGSGWVRDGTAGARYVNPTAPVGGGVRMVRLRRGRSLRIVTRSLGDVGTFHVNGGDPGVVDVILTAGAHRLCAAFDAGEWSPLADGGARLIARRAAPTGTCDAPTTTTTTRPSDCRLVSQPPGSCAGDADCPLGYACEDGACVAGTCTVRADCALDGECVYGEGTDGVCVCRGCGPQACPLGCRQAFTVSGCRCNSESDCPPEDDVCFMGLCS